MRNKARTIHTQQRRPAVFRVVNAFFEIRESAAREQGANLAGDRRVECLLQERAHKVSDALRSF